MEIEKDISGDMNSFQENLNNIQKAASELVSLQQVIKSSGKLTETDRTRYAENLEKLGISAQKLAHIQQSGSHDDFRLLFQGPLFNRQQYNQDVEKTEDDDGDEEDVGEETENSEEGKPDDSIEISSPEKDASIAEAKPVGLAIAGEGGVASSKPIATAVVGPGGLAVARPVATAIAGISPSEVQGLGIPIGSHKSSTKFQSINIPTANRYGLTSISNGIGLLVGPSFSHESRIPGKNLSADEKEDIKAEDDADKIDDNQRILDKKMSDGSNKENNRQEHKPYAGQHSQEANYFQRNHYYPGVQNFQSLNPYSIGLQHFQQGMQSGPSFHEQEYNQGSNMLQQKPNQHPHSPDSILPSQYPFIPPVAPYRFNWDAAPIESTQSYEPIPFMDNRAFNPAPVYPFTPPVNPLLFYKQFQRQY